MAKRPSAGLENVYESRRLRTLAMILSAIAAVKAEVQPISLASIVVALHRIDPAGRGISSSAILRNAQAYSHYERARSWRAPVIPSPRSASTIAVHKTRTH
jgi:hypothetical protein